MIILRWTMNEEKGGKDCEKGSCKNLWQQKISKASDEGKGENQILQKGGKSQRVVPRKREERRGKTEKENRTEKTQCKKQVKSDINLKGRRGQN